MVLVRLEKDWDEPDLLRQTPGTNGVWEGIQFTLAPVSTADYVLVLNRVNRPVEVSCPAENIWAIIQEPPVTPFASWHYGAKCHHRVYTTDPNLRGRRFIHSQPALPWHVDRDYDYLSRCGVPSKTHRLSWITSNKNRLPGHQKRMKLLERIWDEIDFELFGHGFRVLPSKWDGLAPFKYSLAIENHSNPYYWSEKIADCFLAWTMPIYFGCTDISSYFPETSFMWIDIDAPDVVEKIRGIVESDLWEKNLDAIAHARRLVLDRYQLFPFVSEQINIHEATTIASMPKKIRLTNEPYRQLSKQFEMFFHRILHRLRLENSAG